MIVFASPVLAKGTSTDGPAVLVLGDSLSAAYNMDPDEGWVSLLEDSFDRAACPLRLINASISGETSAGGLARLPALLEEHGPDLVLIELGGNDGLRGMPIPTLRQNLERMVELTHGAGARAVLLGIRIPTNYGRRYGDSLAGVYPDLASELDVGLVPFLLEDVALNPELMQADGIHPAAAAQPLLAERVRPLVSERLGCD